MIASLILTTTLIAAPAPETQPAGIPGSITGMNLDIQYDSQYSARLFQAMNQEPGKVLPGLKGLSLSRKRFVTESGGYILSCAHIVSTENNAANKENWSCSIVLDLRSPDLKVRIDNNQLAIDLKTGDNDSDSGKLYKLMNHATEADNSLGGHLKLWLGPTKSQLVTMCLHYEHPAADVPVNACTVIVDLVK